MVNTIRTCLRWHCLLPVLLPVLLSHAVANAAEGWANYNKDYDGQRYSPLRQIDNTNVSRLKPVCQVELSDPGLFESGLVVIGPTLYVTTAHTTVALDAGDCSVRWEHAYTPDQKEVQMVNRGVGYANGRIFRGTGDSRMVAIDA